jgi:hypothetical protein
MLVGERFSDDPETLTEFPDETIYFDLLGSTANQLTAGAVPLRVRKELTVWLRSRLTVLDIPKNALSEVILMLHFRTDRIPTDRKRIISFDFDCESRLATPDRSYQESSGNHVYHSRTVG